MPIVGGRWQPSGGVTVHWSNGKSYTLDPGAQWDGLNAGPGMVNFWQRYAGGKQTEVHGSFIRSIGEETQGGEAFAILQDLFRQQGIATDPSRQEFYDFAIENSPSRLLGINDWIRLTGHRSPNDPGGTGGQDKLQIPASATGDQILKRLTAEQRQRLTALLAGGKTELPALSPADRRVDELREAVLRSAGNHDLPPEAVAMLSPANWPLARPHLVKALKAIRIVRKLAGDPRPIPD